MAQSKLVFGMSGDSRHVLQVSGEAEKVVYTLKNGWAQLNRAKEGDEPQWVWVNSDRVLYVEEVAGESVFEKRDLASSDAEERTAGS
jgi:hypothetical protein